MVNEKLWQVEDEIRGCESAGDFGPRFIELARSVCPHNDDRAALKSKINQLLHSPIAEQKEYSAKHPNPTKEAHETIDYQRPGKIVQPDVARL